MRKKILKHKQNRRDMAPAGQSCLELARERVRYCFDNYDRVTVMFSGGKDSTVCLNLALEENARRGLGPLDVIHVDEEAIPPQTVEYCQRVSERPDVRFHWVCAPVVHRNACSEEEPDWYCWDPDRRSVWCRDLPKKAIVHLPNFRKGMGVPHISRCMFPPSYGNVVSIMGIRTQESLSRLRAIVVKQGDHAFMTQDPDAKWIYKAYPIYDWKSEDVWLAPDQFGWDYNRSYDFMHLHGVPLHAQRCAPPFGEQPIRRLDTYKVCWPELWAKMTQRVRGASTAARYANTELYGFALDEDAKPEDMTWEQYTMELLERLEVSARAEVTDAIRTNIGVHKRYTNDPIPDAIPHPRSGYSWKVLCVPAVIGSNKFDRQKQKVWNMAQLNRTAQGVPAGIELLDGPLVHNQDSPGMQDLK